MPPEAVPWVADVGTDDDPFEEFNRAMGAGRIENPYPDFAELRRNGGVVRADVRRLMGLDDDAALGHTILEMDEPEHHAYRKVLTNAFSRKAMARWETEVVAPVVHAYLDAFVD